MSFDRAFKIVIGHEGGYVNDPDDPGGETKFGISKESYLELDIKNLTLDQAKEIYKRDYWDRLALDMIKSSTVANEMFDTAVNMGVHRGAIIAQKAVNFLSKSDDLLTLDGVVGPKTLGALNKWCEKDALALFRALNGEQYIIYKDILDGRPKSRKYSRGWLRRIQSFREME